MRIRKNWLRIACVSAVFLAVFAVQAEAKEYDELSYEEDGVELHATDPLAEGSRIGILDFDIEGHSRRSAAGGLDFISPAIRSRLVPSGRYEILERDQLAKIAEEKRLQITGIVNDSHGMQALAEAAGLDYMIVGTIKNPKTETNIRQPVWRGRSFITINGRTELHTVDPGGAASKVTNTDGQVASISRAGMHVEVKLWDVVTAQTTHQISNHFVTEIGYARYFTKSGGEKKWREAGQANPDENMMLSQLGEEVAELFCRQLVPWEYRGQLEWFKYDDLDDVSKPLDKVKKSAKKYAELGNFREAYQETQQIREGLLAALESSPPPNEGDLKKIRRNLRAACANLGIIRELYGRLESARDFLDEAMSYSPHDDLRVVKTRISKKLGEAAPEETDDSWLD